MTTTFDVNTGKPLAPGQAQSIFNSATGQRIGVASKTTPPAGTQFDSRGDIVYDPNRITNPNGPSSSSTVGTQNNINTNTQSGMDTANGTKKELSDSEKRIMSTYGFDESYVRGLDSTSKANFAISLRAEDVAQKQADSAKEEQAAIYRSSLAQQNAEYAQHTADLAVQKGKDLGTAQTTAAQLNPYSGGNTDQDSYTGAINVQYTKLQGQLDNTAAQAKAALDSGNMIAYQKINQSMAEMKAKGFANIQNMLTDLKKSDTQESQFAQTEADKKATLKQNDELKNTTLFQNALQNLPQPKGLAELGDDFSKLTSEQQSYVRGQQAFQVGVQAGLTEQGVWSGIKNAAGSAYKQQAADAKNQQIAIAQANSAIAANRAAAYVSSQQAKGLELQNAAALAGNSIYDTTTGFKYVDGTQFYGNDAKNIAHNTAQSAGAILLDKNGIDAVHNIESVRSQLKMIESDLAGKLGTDTWDRLVQSPVNAAKKISQVDPNLASLNIYKDTAIKFLQAVAGGSGSGLRINQAEIDNQIQNLPKSTDTIAVADAKLKKMNQFISEKEALLFPNQKITPKTTSSYTPGFDVNAFITSLTAPKK